MNGVQLTFFLDLLPLGKFCFAAKLAFNCLTWHILFIRNFV